MPVPDLLPPRGTRRNVEMAARNGEAPFNSAEEAWFWFMSWRLMVEDGGTPGYEGRGRTCMPLDMLACLRRLVKPGRLTRRHLQVLAGFGRRLEAPGHGPLGRLWDEGMARLEELFRAKGIVAPEARNAANHRKGGVCAAARNAAKHRDGGVSRRRAQRGESSKWRHSPPPQSQGLPA